MSDDQSSLPPDTARPLLEAGLQHAVLMRAMPVLRHDIAGPLSVMRMGTMLLKRRLGQGEMTPEQAVERVEQLEDQLAHLAQHVRRFRLWDLQIRDRHSIRALVAEAVELARPVVLERGCELEPLPDDTQPWDDSTQVPHTLLYVVLAAIHHLAERPSGAPASILVEPAGADTVRVRAEGAAPPAPALMGQDTSSSGSGTRPPALDLQTLQALARAMGVQLQQSTPSGITVTLPKA